MHINDMDVEIIKLTYKDIYTTYGLSKKMKLPEQIIRKHIIKLNKYGLIKKVEKVNKFIYIADPKKVIVGEGFVSLEQYKKTIFIATEKNSEIHNLCKKLAK